MSYICLRNADRIIQQAEVSSLVAPQKLQQQSVFRSSSVFNIVLNCTVLIEKMEKKLIIVLLVTFVSTSLASERSLNRSDLKCSGRVHKNVTMTAYFPDFSSDDEFDHVDVNMKKLRTLQDFLDGRAEFVTVSMDLDSGIPYGTKVCIPELNEKFERQIPLQARDTTHYSDSNAKSPDFSHIDICVRTEEDTYDNAVNGVVTLYV